MGIKKARTQTTLEVDRFDSIYKSKDFHQQDYIKAIIQFWQMLLYFTSALISQMQ